QCGHASSGRREPRETGEAVLSGRFVRTGVQRHNLMDSLSRQAEQLANRVERFTVRSALSPPPAAPEPENRCVSLGLCERQPVMNVAVYTLGLKRLFAFD